MILKFTTHMICYIFEKIIYLAVGPIASRDSIIRTFTFYLIIVAFYVYSLDRHAYHQVFTKLILKS